jgi:hypothetical protein
MKSKPRLMIFESELTESPETSGRRPSYLRRRVLILFALCFCAIIAALETIEYFSQANNGLASSVEDLHYLWTYGPTAILTIFASLWSRVEYQAKQCTPWQSMVGKHQEADKSVLLDYVSVMQPVALYKALKNKHAVVAYAVVCSIALRLLIVFSTGLFAFQQTAVHRPNVVIQLSDSFSPNATKFDDVGSQPFDILNGVLFEGLAYPQGTNENLTFQQFSAPSLEEGAIVTAPVKGMIPGLECEAASIDITQWEIISTWDLGAITKNVAILNYQINTPSCIVSNVTLNAGHGQVPYIGRFTSAQCEGLSGPDSKRIVVILANVNAGKYSAHHTSDNPSDANESEDDTDGALSHLRIGVGGATWTSRNITLHRSVQMICKPRYAFVKLQATLNTTETLSKAQVKEIGTESSTFSSWNVWTIADKVMEASNYLLNGNRPVIFHDPWNASINAENSTYEIDFALQLGVWLTSTAGNMDLLFEKGVLQNVASSYYRAMAAQTMQIALVRTENSTTTGSVIVIENRVMIVTLVLRVLEVCLVLGLLLALAMIFQVPRKAITPWNVSQVSAITAILSKSHAFRQSLSHTGTASLEVLRSRLRYQLYSLQHTSKGFLLDLAYEDPQKALPEEPPREKRSWKPFPGLVTQIIGFIVVALVITALEVTLRVSQKNDGLGDVSQTTDVHLLWKASPAAIMVLISLFFGSINFNTKSLAPYSRLTKPSGATYAQFMKTNFLDSLDIFNIFLSIRKRNFAVTASTLATIVASFLTIITSGLYSSIKLPQQVSVNFSQETWFRPWYTDVTTGTSSMLVADFIVQRNLTFPRWTYENLAFPELSFSAPKSNINQTTYADIKVPALRSAPICILQNSSETIPQLNVIATQNTTSAPSYTITLNLHRGSCYPDETKSVWTDQPETNITIEYNNLDVLEENAVFGASTTTACDLANSTTISSNGNATTNYIWGAIYANKIAHLWALTCIESVEYIDTITRFELPDFDISTTDPPIPNESTARRVEFEVPSENWDTTIYTSTIPGLDGFFDALVSGRYAIPATYLGSPSKVEDVINAAKFQHNLMVIQQVNNISRVANDTLNPLIGNVTASWRGRLVQHAGSTRILESLLGVMLVLGVVGTVYINTDSVLPKNPCSIAAVASLLADSNILDREAGLGDDFDDARFFIGWLGEEADGAFTIYKADAERDIGEIESTDQLELIEEEGISI